MIAPTKIGKYEIRRQIGRGAMGVVYEAFDTVIERRVAIKTLRLDIFDPSQTADVRARFKREAQSAGQLAHPHVVTVFDYGDHDGTPYIVMEYLAGKELSQILSRGARLPLSEVVRLMTQLLGALTYAHERKVVHRDVKPGNIFILDDGSLKVVDFGLAHVEASNLTDTGALLGTPAYMSPEQFLALPVDERSDIFSAGVILYELLTGDKPFTGTVTSIMQKVLRQEPMEPSVLNPTISTGWDIVVKRAMAKKPDARFQSARQFSETIKQVFEKGSPNFSVEVTLTGAKVPEAGIEKLQPDAAKTSNQVPEQKVKLDSTHPTVRPDKDTSPNSRPFAHWGKAALAGIGVALAFAVWNFKSEQKNPEPVTTITDAERTAKSKADVEEAAQNKLMYEKFANEDAAKRDKAAAEKATFEKAVDERVAQERAGQEKAAEKAARIAEDEAKKKVVAEAARLETLRLQKVEAERLAAEKAKTAKETEEEVKRKVDAELARLERLRAEKAESERLAAEKANQLAASAIQSNRLPACRGFQNAGINWTDCIGTIKYADGTEFRGEFKFGLPEGQGTLYRADGTISQSGTWRSGVYQGR